jgi:outer membrane protein assembly factor BamB
VTEDTVYLASADHNVYAIELKSDNPFSGRGIAEGIPTHKARWTFKTHGAVLAGPALAKNTICVASVDQYIYGLDATTGAEKWKIKGENMFQSNTATDGTRFFVGGWDNTFRAIDADTGHLAWEKKIGRDPKSAKISFYYSPAISSPAVADNKVFVTTNDGVLHAFDTATGDEKWSFDNKKLGYSSPLVHDNKVFIAIGDEGKTFCLSAADGKLLWTSPNLPVVYDSSFTYSNNKVFIGSVNGTLNALDATTGQITWQYHLGPGHVFASPTADDATVYIASLSGKVTALPSR